MAAEEAIAANLSDRQLMESWMKLDDRGSLTALVAAVVSEIKRRKLDL